MIINHPNPAIDAGRSADWGRTSEDYARHRPGPPSIFYDKLAEFGIGLPGQSLLDVGTGTGLLAREMAKRGCHVSASDISGGQVTMARELAEKEGLSIDFKTGPAHAPLFESSTFDVITALQCWWYIDHAAALNEFRRTLNPNGKLAICFFSFLPREDSIVAASEALVLKYNPDWSGADWDGSTPAMCDGIMPEDISADLKKSGMFVIDCDIPFTRESWRGRMRALRGIGASLPPEKIVQFDAEHDALLREMAGENFTIRHRMDAHTYQF